MHCASVDLKHSCFAKCTYCTLAQIIVVPSVFFLFFYHCSNASAIYCKKYCCNFHRNEMTRAFIAKNEEDSLRQSKVVKNIISKMHFGGIWEKKQKVTSWKRKNQDWWIWTHYEFKEAATTTSFKKTKEDNNIVAFSFPLIKGGWFFSSVKRPHTVFPHNLPARLYLGHF